MKYTVLVVCIVLAIAVAQMELGEGGHGGNNHHHKKHPRMELGEGGHGGNNHPHKHHKEHPRMEELGEGGHGGNNNHHHKKHPRMELGEGGHGGHQHQGNHTHKKHPRMEIGENGPKPPTPHPKPSPHPEPHKNKTHNHTHKAIHHHKQAMEKDSCAVAAYEVCKAQLAPLMSTSDLALWSNQGVDALTTCKKINECPSVKRAETSFALYNPYFLGDVAEDLEVAGEVLLVASNCLRDVGGELFILSSIVADYKDIENDVMTLIALGIMGYQSYKDCSPLLHLL